MGRSSNDSRCSQNWNVFFALKPKNQLPLAMSTIRDLFRTEKADNLHELFVDQLKDIYWAENELLTALPKMADAATTDEVKQLIRDHLDETEGHVTRLEKVFASIGLEPKERKCEAMAGLIDEATDIVSDSETDSITRDAGVIAACQKVEHYEIATYGTLRSWAALMAHEEAVRLLSATLEEEESADRKLTALAESFVNAAALTE